MIIHNVEQHSEAWFELRCGRITGTRFQTLVSGRETKGYQELVTMVACEIITGKQEENYTSADMERGTLLEPIARMSFIETIGIDIQEVGFITPDDDYLSEWVGISPDGVYFENETPKHLLEIKCPKPKTHFEYILNGKLPNEYRHQVQGQLFVTGLEKCYFMSYCENMKPFIIEVFS